MSVNNLSAGDKAGILLETLPWLREYSGSRIVIKYGGNAMISEELKAAFAQDVSFLHEWGIEPIVVHGGGPQISSMLKTLGIEATFVSGLRVTSPEVMKVVRMVLTGIVQRELVSLLNEKSIAAIGISGEDGGFLRAVKKGAIIGEKRVDLGLVGEVTAVDPGPLEDLLQSGRIPVVSSIAVNQDNPTQVLNINADLAAAAVAGAIGAKRLIVLTDVEGLYRKWPDPNTRISQITASEAAEMLPALEAGMRPKVQACIQACQQGVPRATIIDGRVPHSMLLEIFTDSGFGTMVMGDSHD
ncbi:acetylglutamate kinase [Varibaculum vaginae]|uniref:acetylglutamate kinase n=1 Tax=Varibaculum vaginae TaxID=2364797 RepID=UPI000F0832E4|nr:acetylglutamate kinase [Varibaculum vaginae]